MTAFGGMPQQPAPNPNQDILVCVKPRYCCEVQRSEAAMFSTMIEMRMKWPPDVGAKLSWRRNQQLAFQPEGKLPPLHIVGQPGVYACEFLCQICGFERPHLLFTSESLLSRSGSDIRCARKRTGDTKDRHYPRGATAVLHVGSRRKFSLRRWLRQAGEAVGPGDWSMRPGESSGVRITTMRLK